MIMLLLSAWVHSKCNLEVTYELNHETNKYDVYMVSDDYDGKKGCDKTTIELNSIDEFKRRSLNFRIELQVANSENSHFINEIVEPKSIEPTFLSNENAPIDPEESNSTDITAYSYTLSQYPSCAFKRPLDLKASFKMGEFHLVMRNSRGREIYLKQNPFSRTAKENVKYMAPYELI